MAHNAIEWGNLHQSDRLVNITYRIYRRPPGDRGSRPGAGLRPQRRLPHAAVAGDPFSHLDVREKLGLRAGGFGLLICQGMVDEMRYNDVGNEVTLDQAVSLHRSRRFRMGPTQRATTPDGEQRIEVTLDQHLQDVEGCMPDRSCIDRPFRFRRRPRGVTRLRIPSSRGDRPLPEPTGARTAAVTSMPGELRPTHAGGR